jgi:hypothetical protein
VEVHFYYDHRSPFAYLAKDLVYGLEDSHPPDRVRVRWLPFAFPVEEGFGLPGVPPPPPLHLPLPSAAVLIGHHGRWCGRSAQ